MHNFTFSVKKMFLADQQAKLYALQYRDQVERFKSLDDDTQNKHPIRKIITFLGKAAFFDEGTNSAQVTPVHVYPDELKFNVRHIVKLISTLKYERRAEIDLLEVFTKLLTEIPSQGFEGSEIDQQLIEILETVTTLVELELGYPTQILNLLCQFSFR